MVKIIAAGVAVLKLLKTSQFDDSTFNHKRRVRSGTKIHCQFIQRLVTYQQQWCS